VALGRRALLITTGEPGPVALPAHLEWRRRGWRSWGRSSQPDRPSCGGPAASGSGGGRGAARVCGTAVAVRAAARRLAPAAGRGAAPERGRGRGCAGPRRAAAVRGRRVGSRGRRDGPAGGAGGGRGRGVVGGGRGGSDGSGAVGICAGRSGAITGPVRRCCRTSVPGALEHLGASDHGALASRTDGPRPGSRAGFLGGLGARARETSVRTGDGRRGRAATGPESEGPGARPVRRSPAEVGGSGPWSGGRWRDWWPRGRGGPGGAPHPPDRSATRGDEGGGCPPARRLKPNGPTHALLREARAGTPGQSARTGARPHTGSTGGAGEAPGTGAGAHRACGRRP
jgi:hypothetical protein